MVTIDTTAQGKDITYPTDAKLAFAILKKCWRLADKCNLKLYQSYTRKTAEVKLKVRFGNHPKKKTEARQAIKDLRRYAKKVIGQLRNHLSVKQLEDSKIKFARYDKVLLQKTDDRHKI